MPGGVVRIGDILGPGGVIGPPASVGIYVNGRPAALVGATYTPHPCCGEKKCPPTHCFGVVLDIPVGVYFNGLPPLTKSGRGICKHGIRTASTDVIVAGGGLLGTAFSIAGSLAGGGLDSGSFVEKLAEKIAFDVASQVTTQAGR